MNLKEDIRDGLADLVEEHFPKGQCQERGQAMVLVAYAEMFFLEAVSKSLDTLLGGLPEKKSIPYSPEFTQQPPSARAEGFNAAVEEMHQAIEKYREDICK